MHNLKKKKIVTDIIFYAIKSNTIEDESFYDCPFFHKILVLYEFVNLKPHTIVRSTKFHFWYNHLFHIYSLLTKNILFTIFFEESILLFNQIQSSSLSIK